MGERSERTQPDASEAISDARRASGASAPSRMRAKRSRPAHSVDRVRIVLATRLAEDACARSPRVAVLLHHQPRALLFLQLRRANEPGRTPLRPRRQNPRLLEQLRKRRLSRIHVVRARRHFEAHPYRLHGRRVAEDDFFVEAAPANEPRGAARLTQVRAGLAARSAVNLDQHGATPLHRDCHSAPRENPSVSPRLFRFRARPTQFLQQRRQLEIANDGAVHERARAHARRRRVKTVASAYRQAADGRGATSFASIVVRYWNWLHLVSPVRRATLAPNWQLATVDWRLATGNW